MHLVHRAPIERIEKAFSIWIDDSSKKFPLNDSYYHQIKNIKIYKHFKEHEESSVNLDFVASKD